MNWQKSLRVLWVATTTTQIATLVFALDAIRLEKEKVAARREIEAILSTTYPSGPKKRDLNYMVAKLPNVLLGLLRESDTASGNSKRDQDLQLLRERVIGIAGTLFEDFGRNLLDWETIATSDWTREARRALSAIEEYARTSDVANVRRAQTRFDSRMLDASAIAIALRTYKKLEPDLAQRVTAIADALADYDRLRLAADRLAMLNGHIANRTALAYGPASGIAVQDATVEPLRIFGIKIGQGRPMRWVILGLSVVFYSMLLRVLWLSKQVTFSRSPAVDEGWFALALPLQLRYLVLLVGPTLLLATIVFLAWRLP